MTYKEQSKHLAGPIALLKMQCTRVENSVADDAVQVGVLTMMHLPLTPFADLRRQSYHPDGYGTQYRDGKQRKTRFYLTNAPVQPHL